MSPLTTTAHKAGLKLPEDGPELSAETGLHQHVEILPVLEGLVELDDELTVGLLHDLLLGHDVLLLTSLNDLEFFLVKH